jgi:hypothetical protein
MAPHLSLSGLGCPERSAYIYPDGMVECRACGFTPTHGAAGPVVRVEIDGHGDGPFDGIDGRPSMVEVAERFGIMVVDITAGHPLERWAWWWTFTGPREHVRRAITAYWDAEVADNYLGCANSTTTVLP